GPRGAPGAGASCRPAVLRARRPRPPALHRGIALLRHPGLAQLPGRRAEDLNMRRLAAGLALALITGFAERALAVDLDGFWYVLVHYQDSETENSHRWRVVDRGWTFAKKANRLEWTEYPIVEFADNSGRFEATRGGRATRV